MRIKKIFLLLQISIFGLLALPTMVGAGNAYNTGTVTVAITVSPSCTVSANGMNFGTYSFLQLDATSTFNVTCTNGTSWSAALSAGSGSYSNRKMTSGSNVLNYNLYTSALKLQVWGDGTSGTAVVTGTGNGLAQTKTVYGTLPGLQSALYGTYMDTISVIVTFS